MRHAFLTLLACAALACPADDTSDDGTPTTSGGTTVGNGTTTNDATTTSNGTTSTDPSTDGSTTSVNGSSTTATDPDSSSGGSTEGPTSGSSGGPMGDPPVIESITWEHVPGCMAGTGSDVTITIIASDPDDDPGTLVFSGSLAGCGAIDSDMVTVVCPQAAPYAGNVTVTDPNGNSDMLGFTVEVCTDGTAP